MSQYVAKPVFLRVEEDGGVSLMKREINDDDRQEIENGTLQILRFTPFSPEAQDVADRGGRLEALEVSSVEEEPEDEAEEGEVVWGDSWLELR